ncbi:MAG: FAD-binding oxidoreductase [Gammaproteobacteria bacterium]|nr:MAG: FAD-binding oxidoreductase [Gammaproteobacteria bacterium]
MNLPPGLSRSDFSSALGEFRVAVGKDWVLTDAEDLDGYCDEFGPYRGTPEERIPSAAVAPDTVEEVQKVVRVANSYRIPLWMISCGRNFGYGGGAPRLSGSVVLDLKRMNRIIELSEGNACALVEPGVSSFDLYREIRRRGLKLWMDGPSPAWASVVGSTLERGIGHSLLGDRWSNECGMEVVLANGDVVRTGMGGLPGTGTWQQYKWGFGPHIDGLFSQSNFGVVTKMGTWLMPEPENFLACFVDVPRSEDLIALIDILRPLRQSEVVRNAVNIRPVRRRPGDPPGESGGWRALLGFYGRNKSIDLLWEHVQGAYSAIPGVRFRSQHFSAPYDPETMDWQARWLSGIPSMSELSRWDHSSIFASQILPFSGEAAWNRIRVLDSVYREFGRRYQGGSINAHHPRALVALAGCPVSRDNPEANRNAVALMRRVLEVGAQHGWGPYREGTALMDEAMSACSFNDHALLRFLETLKDALDPNGILAAGKSGIWPQQLR